MARAPKRLPAAFYQSPSGAEPVRAWLKALDDDDRRIVGEDIATVEFGWPVGMPVCKALGGGIWEIRSTVSGSREARVFFGIAGDHLVLLHAFIKKSRKTPPTDLKLAKDRLKELTR